MSRLWDKGIELDQRVLAYTAGEDYALDERLVEYDVRASIAHAEMLNAQELLDDADLKAIRDGLTAIGAEHAAGEWKIELADEDGQTALEKRLTERIGAAGGRVHLGRSRNDQVLTALRLYLLDVVDDLSAAAEDVAKSLDGLAAREGALLRMKVERSLKPLSDSMALVLDQVYSPSTALSPRRTRKAESAV